MIEHQFVTVFEARPAMELVRRFLQMRGFIGDLHQIGPPPALETSSPPMQRARLEMRRGHEKAKSAESVSDLPQHAVIDFDRGRVSLAVAITPSTVWGGVGLFHPDGVPGKLGLHRDLLHAVADGIGQLLTANVTAEQAAASWAEVEARIAEEAAKRTRRRRLAFGALVLFLIGLFSFIGYLIARGPR